MAVPPRMIHKRRATITALPLYYSGYLFKKQTGEKDFKKYYGELRGDVLFLYEDDTQDTYIERLDLDQYMHLDSSFNKTTPSIFTLTTHTKEVQLKMDNADAGEEWRGYILTVMKKEIPSTVQLLPGQMLLLKEALAQEKKRTNVPGTNPPLPPRPSFLFTTSPASPSSSAVPQNNRDTNSQEMPSCFFGVSRQEAETMLNKNPEFGNIILRPSSRANSYGLTLRQLTSSGVVMKNYRVTSTNTGFIIELESPVKVPTLNDVINYVLEKTEYRLQPYTTSEPYDTRIEKPLAPPSLTLSASKTIPKARVPPMVQASKDEPRPSSFPPGNSEYLVPEDECINHKKTDNFDGELRKVLLLRREVIYSSNDNDAMYELNP